MTQAQAIENLDEVLLIEQCQQELPYVMTAFAELVRRHERYVFNVCRRYLGSESDAEDTTQEVFLRVFHALPGFEGRAQFRTWLYRITMNQCHALSAKRKPMTVQSTEEDDSLLDSLADESSPEQELEEAEDRDCVQRSLLQMREQDMEILSLRFMGELSLDEIAETMRSKLSATKMRFYRAMEQFKAIYERLCL